MAKLITAKEAFALTDAANGFDYYIQRINQNIRHAAASGETSTSCTFCCGRPMMSRLAGRVAGAGYNIGWKMIDESCGYMQISWGES